MNRIARWILRLYPAHWRKRYGDEVDALLTDAGADARTVADLAKGGVRMQFSTWSFPKLTLTLGLVGLVLGAAFSLFLPSEYVSRATLRVTGTGPLNEHVQMLLTEVDSHARLIPIIRKLNLYPDPTLDDVVERMRNDILVEFVAAPKSLQGSSAFDILFTYPDRYKAQQTVQALMTAFNEINVAFASDHPASPVFVLAEANLPSIGPVGNFLETFIPHEYHSAATLRLTQGTDAQVAAIAERAFSNDYLSTLLKDPRFMLYHDERSKSPDDVLRLMRSHLQILHQGNRDGSVFTVAFDYKDRYRARQVVEALTNRFSAVSAEMSPASARELMGPPAILDVLNTANLPSTTSKPNRPAIALMGGIIGVLLAFLMALFHHRWAAPRFAVNG